MKKNSILIIDDEPQIQKLLQITLQSQGYTVNVASTSKEGLTNAANTQPDLVILDLGLPDESGHKTLTKLRGWYNKPIIILSVLNSEKNIVTALDVGANDYIVKPFRTGELLARIRSTLRKQETDLHKSVFNFQDLEIDFTAHTVKRKSEFIKLTSTQFELLRLFVKNEGKVLTYSYLLKQVWGDGYNEQVQYLRVFIAQLRKKIEVNPENPGFIKNESGVGYRFLGNE